MEEDNNRLREQLMQLNAKKQRMSTVIAEEAHLSNLVKENESLKSKLAFQVRKEVLNLMCRSKKQREYMMKCLFLLWIKLWLKK